jgi:hypothetical protein
VGIDQLVRRLAGLAPDEALLDGLLAPLSHAERRDDIAVLVLST